MPQPHPALKRLEKLIGTWEMTGHPVGSQEIILTGRTVINWILDGFFLELRGEISVKDTTFQSLEIVGYDPESDTFPSWVFSGMDRVPMSYFWDGQGDVITHWTMGAKYTGTFSADGNTLSGGWRPDAEVEPNPGNNYDAIMTRVK